MILAALEFVVGRDLQKFQQAEAIDGQGDDGAAVEGQTGGIPAAQPFEPAAVPVAERVEQPGIVGGGGQHGTAQAAFFFQTVVTSQQDARAQFAARAGRQPVDRGVAGLFFALDLPVHHGLEEQILSWENGTTTRPC